MNAPRAASERPMICARAMVGSRRSMQRATASRKAASGLIRMDCACSSCSACENRSSAIHSGSVPPSQITAISDGPAIMSMPTSPNTWRLASATYTLPGPTILSTRGTVAVPKASAATACAPPIVNTRSTPAIAAAASTTSFSSPRGAGTTITSSPTPATRAGMPFISTDEG